MSRSPQTPLVLWICAAVCVHFMFAEGGDQVATYEEDRRFIFQLGASARGAVRGVEQSIDIVSTEEGVPSEPEAEKPKPEATKEDEKKPEADPAKPKDATKPEPPKVDVKIVQKKDEDPLKKLDQVPLQPDNRIAVKQHAPKAQADNPTAKFIADEANKVDEETAATQTAHDQDDPNPTPGGNKATGSKDNVGDSERTKIADSDDHKGEKDKAPGEKGTLFDVQKEAKPIDRAQAAVAIQAPPSPNTPRAGGDARPPAPSPNPTPPELTPGAPPAPSPEVVSGAQGGWTFSPIRSPSADPNVPGSPGTTNQQRPPTPRNNSSNMAVLGLGGSPGPGQVNLNLTQAGVIAIVGNDQLRKEREADGERRKSEHRGSWTASNFERWRNAIENYVSSVKPGNQTALNTAAVPFASYLNTIHNRIHPLFADSFLGSLDHLPKGHPMNDLKIVTRLEIVVSPKDGRIVKMGIVKTSGITAFDIAALDSVHRAQPFGPAPQAIVSPDGHVYLHWEFHRDENLACSTMNARPFMLTTPAKPGPDPEPPGGPNPPSPTQERGAPAVNVPYSREGALTVRRSSLGS